MRKSELKSIIKECLYENGVIEEPINEGFFNKAPDHDKVKKDLKAKFKSIGTSTVKDRLSGRVKKLDTSAINKAESILKSYFKCLGDQSGLVEVTIDYVTDHYEKTYNATTSNGVYCITVNYMFDFVTIKSVSSTGISSLDIPKDIVELLIEKNQYGYDLSFSKNSVKYNGTCGVNKAVYVKGAWESFSDKMVKELDSKGYNAEFSGMGKKKLTITKK